ncbi:tetratricopeptide repeat protein [Reichenbachiella agarivorans]|uniref:Tetratricopeptide repeat protein n=1 Tax=Reichenbachiella agarivorans TaxID=2979464 RepID=A0ABY6CLF9_9BACT|nr:tetratricopeptide repeat protein [Reichenbachiella agarivorans]UXP31352.1 tetratricopeptide repeat protein [Reichenbachiella agarivorans]
MNKIHLTSPLQSLFLILVLVLLANLSVQGQDLDQDARFRHAKLLYQKNAYVAARLEFSKITAKQYEEEVAYFIASCAVRAGQDDGEYLIQQFVQKYPYNPHAKGAFFDLGNYYFDRGEYAEAIKNYDKSNEEYSTEMFFKKGYALFNLGKKEEALKSFAKLEGSYTEYEKDGAYFQGYILYHQGKVKESFKYLQTGFESKQFGIPSFELYVSALYSDKKYKQLITLVDSQDKSVTSQNILNYYADAHYALGEYRKAADDYAKLFDKYSRARNEKNYFKSGYSNYKLGNKDTAEDQLKRSAVADDTVGAYASYYLGVLYHKDQNYQFSVTSFENTTKYDTRLKEDATFQLSKTLMEIPNYDRAVNVLTGYLKDYPNSKYKEQAGDMLGMAYALTDNYDLAMNYIESRKVLTPQMKTTYQRVSFMKGMSLFNDKKFGLAVEVFQKSLIHDMDHEITQNAYYWTGESLSLLGREDESLFYYRSVVKDGTQLYPKSLYSKAYAHFNLGQYQEAKDAFVDFESRYTPDINKNYLSDTYLRLGDCYFALKNYNQGINFYQKAITAGNKKLDDLYFQIGLLNRYLDKNQEAKNYFNKLIKEIPKSPKIDQAQYQIAKIEFEKGDGNKAIDAYRKFIINYPSSSFVPFALLDQAVAFDNKGETASSIRNYKEILERFPRHEVANSALLGLQQKSNQGSFGEFDQYLAMYKAANPQSQALENIEFETAQAQYYSQKYTLAISGFLEFVKSYPKSPLAVSAKYFIADSYFRLDQDQKSLDYFYQIEGNKDFSKYDKVLYRIATLEAKKKEYPKSNNYYHKLRVVSGTARNMIFVETGLMENFFAMKKYDSAVYYGTSLLRNANAGVLVESQANLTIGKAKYLQSKYEDALVYLLPLVSNSPDERGAEAYLYISKIYYAQKKYDTALESLFVLTNNFKNYEYWRGEAYLLMSDIYLETDEVFQAKATLNSLLDNSTQTEIKARAQEKLKKINEVNNENN